MAKEEHALSFEDKVTVLKAAAKAVKDCKDLDWSEEWREYLRDMQHETGIRIGIDGKLYANQ